MQPFELCKVLHYIIVLYSEQEGRIGHGTCQRAPHDKFLNSPPLLSPSPTTHTGRHTQPYGRVLRNTSNPPPPCEFTRIPAAQCSRLYNQNDRVRLRVHGVRRRRQCHQQQQQQQQWLEVGQDRRIPCMDGCSAGGLNGTRRRGRGRGRGSRLRRRGENGGGDRGVRYGEGGMEEGILGLCFV